MTTKFSPRSCVPGALKASPTTASVPLEWYIEGDQHIYDNPDWATLWVAKRQAQMTAEDGLPSNGFKGQYRHWVDAFYGHPDAERGAALAWELHDAVKASMADRAWLRQRQRQRQSATYNFAPQRHHSPNCRCVACARGPR